MHNRIGITDDPEIKCGYIANHTRGGRDGNSPSAGSGKDHSKHKCIFNIQSHGAG